MYVDVYVWVTSQTSAAPPQWWLPLPALPSLTSRVPRLRRALHMTHQACPPCQTAEIPDSHHNVHVITHNLFAFY